MRREQPFKTEAELCAEFIAWAKREHEMLGCRYYAEWDGWDILVVYPDGTQLGLQAKLRLNADVLAQAAPDRWWFEGDTVGPDFRGVLVPENRGACLALAHTLGLEVFYRWGRAYSERDGHTFMPGLSRIAERRTQRIHDAPMDWNPKRRHELPPVETDSIAGSPCPVTLTPWKLVALDVLAELEVKGTIRAKRIAEIGVSPSRWLSAMWLIPAETRGDWKRGPKCPRFEDQHPSAYALALAKAKASAGVAPLR